MVRVRLWESFRAVFYTPFYAALARGAFAENGLDIAFGATPPGLDIADAFARELVDVTWGGPMRVMVAHDRDPGSDLVGFCEVVGRDPFSLLGRSPEPPPLADIARLRLATVAEVPTPWMCLQQDLRDVGIDPTTLPRRTAMAMTEAVDALLQGEVDVAQLFEPFVEQVLRSGRGHLWYAAAGRGPTSYTSLLAPRRFLEQRPDTAWALVQGLYDTQRWLHAQTPETIATAVQSFFGGLAPDVLNAAIRRYLASGIWTRTPVLAEDGFARQARSLLSGGLIHRPAAFAACVDTTIARAVVAAVDAEQPRIDQGGGGR